MTASGRAGWGSQCDSPTPTNDLSLIGIYELVFVSYRLPSAASGFRFNVFVIDQLSHATALRAARLKIARIAALTVAGRAFSRGPSIISNFR
jgi:hypothetical protein